MKAIPCCGISLLLLTTAWAAPMVEKVSAPPDPVRLSAPGEVELGGWLGNRVQLNTHERLAKVDLEPLLAGFRKKPGTHPWIGEHIGKWMHAASLSWAASQSDELKRKLDYAVAELIKAQEADGYLGTYLPQNRFQLAPGNDWDVWSHKYCLMGLLTYYHYTGDMAALDASRKAADLLLATFGPGKKSLISAGTHVGMAATSVLEPMVLLYRHTGDSKYLDFCKYIVASWNEPGGPRILDSLRGHGQVHRTANAKAYEMLSNLVGLAELSRVTGDRTLLQPIQRAWEDIVQNRLYLTGSTSQAEHFKEDHYLPNGTSANVAETCVTTTWIQLNSQLLRLTGEARYGNELERTFYNHLSAAQRPDGRQWCYFTSLEGAKPYGPGINCCVSSGPRGMAMAALHTFLISSQRRGEPTLFVNLLETAKGNLSINENAVQIEQEMTFLDETSALLKIRVRAKGRPSFRLAVRQPAWVQSFQATQPDLKPQTENGWFVLSPRSWRGETLIPIRMQLAALLVPGTHGNAGTAALRYGPYVLAYDDAVNEERSLQVAWADPLNVKLKAATPRPVLQAMVRSVKNPQPHPADLVTFADAGETGSRFKVWLPDAKAPVPDLSGSGIAEDRSRPGNVEGSIADTDLASFVVTFDGTRKDADWYTIELSEPQEIRGVEFAHGKTFHDGGWFDTSSGKPKIQVQRKLGSHWETVGELTNYPATTATNPKDLKPGQVFSIMLEKPERAAAIRVIGTPAHGDNPAQAFSSCAELKAIK